MVYGRFATERQDLETANAILARVFEGELGLVGEEDGEDFALSALVFTGDPGQSAPVGSGPAVGAGSDPIEAAGAGRLVFDGTRFVITEVAVLPAYRGQAYGDFLVRLLVNRGEMAGAKEITLDALVGTEAFFAKIGFSPKGETYSRAGEKWQPMVLAVQEMIRGCQACQATERDAE